MQLSIRSGEEIAEGVRAVRLGDVVDAVRRITAQRKHNVCAKSATEGNHNAAKGKKYEARQRHSHP